MKLDWGYKIALIYTAFAVFMIGLVVKSMKQTHDLVTENYYEEELKFQQQINKKNLVKRDGKKVEWKHENNFIELVFPATGNVSGKIKLFRPSEAAKDISVSVNPDNSGRQQIDVSVASKGKYLLQIDWKENGNEYFQEAVIII